MKRAIIAGLAYLLAVGGSASAQELSVGTLNVESAFDTLPFQVGQVMVAAGPVDVWALQEVADAEDLKEFTIAASVGSGTYRMIQSVSGANSSHDRRSDFLGIVYNSSELREVEVTELHAIRSIPDGQSRLGTAQWRLRGALFARFQHRDTGLEFYVGNVHLKCCGPSNDLERDGERIRAHQARLLAQWVEERQIPVILIGDFNIPVNPEDLQLTGDPTAFNELTRVLEWKKPSNPMPTQCSDRFNSILDHVFVTPEGPNMEHVKTEIAATEADFCDDDKSGSPDHRPVVADFALSN